MAIGLTPHLAGVFSLVMLVALYIARRHLPFPVAAGLVLARIAVSVSYFAFLDDGRWALLDDQTYFAQAQELLGRGFTPWSAVTTTEGIVLRSGLSGGIHIGYLVWNLLLMWAFGAEYYVPVAGNVLLSILAADGVVRLATRSGFDDRYRQGWFVFLAMHWDFVAWSSFHNLKDMLLTYLELLVLLRLAAFSETRTIASRAVTIGLLVVLGAALFSLRFYAPVLLAVAVLFSVVLVDEQLRRRLSIVLVLVTPALALAVQRMLPTLFEYAVPGQWLVGIARAFLTPQPWSVAPDHGFLLLPSWLHLLFLPLFALGAVRLWTDAPRVRVLLLFLLVAIAFYGLVPELQGPRQRFQVSFVIAWGQFHGALVALAALRLRNVPHPASLVRR